MNNKKELILVGILLIVTLFTRFYKINTVPMNIHPDGMDAARLYLLWNDDNRGDFWSRSNWNGSHAINNYFLTIPWDLLGRPFWGMRVGPAITSILTILLFYYSIKLLTNNASVSFMSCLLLSADPWFLNFSRSSWENIANALVVTALVYAYALRNNKIFLSIIITAVSVIIAPYLYHPGKIIFVVGLMLLYYYLILIYREPIKKKLLHIYFLTFSIIVAILPLAINSNTSNWGRIINVSVFSYEHPFQAIKQNIIRTSLALVLFRGDQWHVGINDRYLPTHGQVMFVPLVVMFWLGVLIATKKSPCLILMFVLLFFPINISSIGTPDAARSVHIVPLLYTFIAYGLVFVFVDIAKFVSKFKFGMISYKLLTFFSVLILTLNGYIKYWNWINLESTALVREPSIYLSEYQEWLSTTQDLVRTKGITQSIGEWRAEHPIPTPHMRR